MMSISQGRVAILHGVLLGGLRTGCGSSIACLPDAYVNPNKPYGLVALLHQDTSLSVG